MNQTLQAMIDVNDTRSILELLDGDDKTYTLLGLFADRGGAKLFYPRRVWDDEAGEFLTIINERQKTLFPKHSYICFLQNYSTPSPEKASILKNDKFYCIDVRRSIIRQSSSARGDCYMYYCDLEIRNGYNQPLD